MFLKSGESSGNEAIETLIEKVVFIGKTFGTIFLYRDIQYKLNFR